MASAQVIIELHGLRESLAGFTNLEERLTKLKPLWERFEDEFHTEEKSLFERAPWTPLKPETEARKAKLYGGPSRILIASGRLFRSLTEEGSEGNISRISDDGAEFGSEVPYGVFHEDTRNPLVEPDEEKYNTIAGEYVAEMIKEAGFD